MRFLCLILSFCLIITSCTDSQDNSSTAKSNNLSSLTVNVEISDAISKLYAKDKNQLDISLQINEGSQQNIMITENTGQLIISSLAYSAYHISIIVDYRLPNTKIPVATFSTTFELTKNHHILNISAGDFVDNLHDADRDGNSNLIELLADSNPIGTYILVTSAHQYTVIIPKVWITRIFAYAANAKRPLVYTLNGGLNQDWFRVNSHTGDLSFIYPPSLNSNLLANRYQVTINISDGIESTNLDLSVYISDIFKTDVSLQYKTIVFSWQAIENAHHYQLLARPQAMVDFQIVESAMTQTSYRYPISSHLYDKSTLFKIEAFDANENRLLSSQEFQVTGRLIDAIGVLKATPPKLFSHFGEEISLSADGKLIAIGTPLESLARISVEDLSRCNFSFDCYPGGVHLYAFNGKTWILQQHLMPIVSYDSGFGKAVSLSNDGRTLIVGVNAYQVATPDINSNHLDDCQLDPTMQTNCSKFSGGVFVYQFDGSAWHLAAILKGDNTESGDNFGLTADISGDGNTIVVGAPTEDSAAVNINGNALDDCEVLGKPKLNCIANSGAAYIFRRENNHWVQQAYLKSSATTSESYGYFGISISDDGNTVAIGAISESSASSQVNGLQIDDCHIQPIEAQKNCAEFSGAVYVYHFVDNAWQAPSHIKPINTHAQQDFGRSISLSGDGRLLAVGSIFENGGASGLNGNPVNDCVLDPALQNNCSAHSGAVYLYQYNNLKWQPIDYIKPPYRQANMSFGSVFLSKDGSHLAVGASGEASAQIGIASPIQNCDPPQVENFCTQGSGAVFFYRVDGLQWLAPKFIKAPDLDYFDRFGTKVALDHNGNTLIVSSPFERSLGSGFNDPTTDIRDTTDRPESGAVYLY